MCIVFQYIHDFFVSPAPEKLLTIIIALFGVWIAYQQWKLAREKFILDRFERRYAVYTGLIEFIKITLAKAKTEPDDFKKLRETTSNAIFLFPRNVYEYIEKLEKKVILLNSCIRKLDEPNVDRKSESQKIEEIMNWLTEQLDVAPQKFKAYLDISK